MHAINGCETTSYKFNVRKVCGFKKFHKDSSRSLYLKFYDRICGALRDLVLFVQFKKCEKYPWINVNFSKVAGCFSRFLNCTNGIKSCNTHHILS